MPEAPEKPASPPSKKGVALGCLGVVALVIGLPVACTLALGDGTGEWEPTTTEARAICEGWVEDQLKSPATAKFQDGGASGGPSGYTIDGTVDSENSFGALVRSDWTCDIRWDESGDQWRGSARVAS